MGPDRVRGVGLQWKRNFEVDYPSNPVQSVCSLPNQVRLSYENELMYVPGSLAYRQRFAGGNVKPEVVTSE